MSAFQLINPPGLYDPAPNGYSHLALVAPGTRLLLVSGQGGEDAQGDLPEGFEPQLRQALDNVVTALHACGAKPTDVARLLVLVVDHDEGKLEAFGRALSRHWDDAMKPACTLVPVPRLALDGMLIEIEATAAIAA
ncbi:RidA family protein [Pseudoxanthomonas putridarboris]|uniref:RidA family protein n=1 Tax=Pseudoxanthomonas putridarboris TaxID=752605 RepID=A0ABU9J3D6_9GAMM